MTQFETFIDLLQQRKSEQKPIISFIDDDQLQTWSYQDLDIHARNIAAELRKTTLPNDRVLILLPPGLDYIASYFGCFYAGCIAVPLYPPPRNKIDYRVEAIYKDAQAKVALINSSMKTENLPDIKKIEVDAVSPDKNFKLLQRSPNDIAFLQYTSGSTASPKGVMVSHRNLIANCQAIQSKFYRKGIIEYGCFWIPPFHDMGLIGGILSPLYAHYHTILFSPKKFIHEPLFWLKVINEYRANLTAIPNFALDMCVNEIEKQPTIDLDLSCIKVMVNGSEPVRAASIKNFITTFEKYGLNPDAIYPSYGLAEATLFVSAKNWAEKNKILSVHKETLINKNRIQMPPDQDRRLQLVSCGTPVKGFDLKIVNITSNIEVQPLEIGEIWLSGPSITLGYWKKPELNLTLYHAHLANDNETNYLKTGDLGFVDEDNNLYITGRIKDVIIIYGKNYYPQDIENIVQYAHANLILHGTAALGENHEGYEYLTIIQEVHRHARDFKIIFNAIQAVIAQEFGLVADKIVLISQSSLPKTSSGKVRRQTCKQSLHDQSLKIVSVWKSERLQEDESR